jgi:hypothetical protein
MRTQLQAISLRIQTVRSNEQMMQAMKGATSLLGSMNRQMNLPVLQRIAMEFERENDIMDQRQEMMDDAIDDVTGLEDEEEEDEVVNQILDELGIDLGQAVSYEFLLLAACPLTVDSSERRRRACTRRRWRRGGSRRQLGVATPRTTIYRRGWTACGDDGHCGVWRFYASRLEHRSIRPTSTYDKRGHDATWPLHMLAVIDWRVPSRRGLLTAWRNDESYFDRERREKPATGSPREGLRWFKKDAWKRSRPSFWGCRLDGRFELGRSRLPGLPVSRVGVPPGCRSGTETACCANKRVYLDWWWKTKKNKKKKKSGRGTAERGSLLIRQCSFLHPNRDC